MGTVYREFAPDGLFTERLEDVKCYMQSLEALQKAVFELYVVKDKFGTDSERYQDELKNCKAIEYDYMYWKQQVYYHFNPERQNKFFADEIDAEEGVPIC